MTLNVISQWAIIAPRNVQLALVSRATGQLQSLARQAHGRAILLADIRRVIRSPRLHGRALEVEQRSAQLCKR